MTEEKLTMVEILTFFENFKDGIESAIDLACHAINKLKEGVAEAVEKADQELKQTVKQDFQTFMDAINELRQQAATANVDVTTCIEKSENKLIALRQDCLSTIENCLKEIENEANTGIRNTMDIVEALASEVTMYGKRLQHCTKASEEEQDACIAKLKCDILESMVSLPPKITAGLQSITDYVNKLVYIDSLPKLEPEVISNLKGRGSAIVAKLTECVNKSINSVTLNADETQITKPEVQ